MTITTGTSAFDRARGQGAILVLDEIDALAKRRDDLYDVGEFKRVVSTLLLNFIMLYAVTARVLEHRMPPALVL